MKTESLDFLTALLNTPGPSGFESAPARVWRDYANTFADTVDRDTSGNSIAALKAGLGPRVMLAGHMDEIGFMVHHIDDNGFLYFSTIGGWDHQVFVGQRVVILTKNGAVEGVIGKKAIHLIKSEDRDTASSNTDLWIDIGARTGTEAKKKIRIGDAGVLASQTLRLPNRRLVSRSIDNRIGSFIAVEALRMARRFKLTADVYAVATTREEIAWTGGGALPLANSIDPAVVVVVDVTHATDHPSVEAKEHGDVKLGKGPVLTRGSSAHPVVFEMLVKVAEAEKIPYQLAAAPGDTGTDADAIHTARNGIPTAVVSIPNRYMHSPNEMVDLGDVEKTAKLLAHFTKRISRKTDFRPA